MKYGEKITELINTIEKVYSDAEWLRDIATEEEKKYFNELRRKMYVDYSHPLIQLREKLSNERYNMNLK